MRGTAGDLLFTPEDVAEQLGLHVRTVRRYIREGQLEAVKVGKRYRVTREALERFAGISLASTPASTRPFTEVSTIVSVDDLTRESADRMTTLLMSSAQGRRSEAGPLKVETIYYPERRRLKVICNGDMAATLSMLALVNTLLATPP